MVPLLDTNAQNLPLGEDLQAAFNRVLNSGHFIMGGEVTAFEEECAGFLGAKHAIGVSSGTDALIVALIALGIGPGDEVICPSFTFFATAGAISRVGATPVFADVCPVCFNLEVAATRAKITDKTKAIIPVHLFGQSAEMRCLQALAKEHGLSIIEDTAQAFGAKYRGQSCGTFGDFGTYSFFPSKNLGALGDAGLLVTNDDELAETARAARNHGSKIRYLHEFVGGNFRLDALQAALLRVKLGHYASYSEARNANAAAYTEALSKIEGITLADEKDCACPVNQAAKLKAEDTRAVLPVAYGHNGHIWNQYTLRILNGQRDNFREHLKTAEIGHEVYYPIPMHRQPCFSELPEKSLSDCPVSDTLAREVVSIPAFPELSVAQRDEVIASVTGFLAS